MTGPSPVEEGLAVAVYLPSLRSDGTPSGERMEVLACTECGVLVWDVDRHWKDAHSNRLEALRSIRAREEGVAPPG